jgi:hypothetical protein
MAALAGCSKGDDGGQSSEAVSDVAGTATPAPTAAAADLTEPTAADWSRRIPAPGDPDHDVPYGANGRLIPTLLEGLYDADQLRHDQAVAEHFLTKQCMEDQGFDYDVPPMVSESTGNEVPALYGDATIGLIDPIAARTNGYALPQYVVDWWRANVTSPVYASDEERSREFYEALDGSPDKDGQLSGGCRQAAAGQLWDETAKARVDDAIVQMENQIVADAAAAPAVVDGISQWSACMKDKGFDYPNPGAAQADQAWQDEYDAVGYTGIGLGDEPGEEFQASETQIRTATADIECKEVTGLIPTYRAALWAAQQDASREGAATLAELKQLATEAKERIAKVLAQAE